MSYVPLANGVGLRQIELKVTNGYLQLHSAIKFGCVEYKDKRNIEHQSGHRGAFRFSSILKRDKFFLGGEDEDEESNLALNTLL